MNVYTGNYGDYVIPPEVLKRAQEMNAGKRLSDKRTRGAKYLEWWGRCQDANEQVKFAIKRHYGV